MAKDRALSPSEIRDMRRMLDANASRDGDAFGLLQIYCSVNIVVFSNIR